MGRAYHAEPGDELTACQVEARSARRLPILVTFDTYEMIAERDAIVRVVIRAAGPRVAWVVAGRRDLYETRTSTPAGRVDGYREEDRHAYDVTRLVAILYDLRIFNQQFVEWIGSSWQPDDFDPAAVRFSPGRRLRYAGLA